MLVVVTHDGRPKPENTSSLTGKQRIQSFRTTQAYRGSYTLHGDRIEHHSISRGDEIRAGTTVVR
jgi:hypothetical protein